MASDLVWRSGRSHSVPFLVGLEPALGKPEGFGNKGAELQGFSAGLPWLPARGAARRLLGGKLVTVRRFSAFRGVGVEGKGWRGCAPQALATPSPHPVRGEPRSLLGDVVLLLPLPFREAASGGAGTAIPRSLPVRRPRPLPREPRAGSSAGRRPAAAMRLLL